MLCLETFQVPGADLFGSISESLWSIDHPPEGGLVTIACNSLIARLGERVILVDAGLGDHTSRQTVRQVLGRQGCSPGQITDLVITHLHYDHAGGLTYRSREGRATPTFPSARHWVQAEHLDFARRHPDSFPPEIIDPLVQADLFHLVRGDEEIMPGLELQPLFGHTRAMQAVLIGAEPPIWFPADLLPTRAHLAPQSYTNYDLDPNLTVKEKSRMLDLAVRGGWRIVFAHERGGTSGCVEMFQ